MSSSHEPEEHTEKTITPHRAAIFDTFAQTLQMHIWQSHKMNSASVERMGFTWPQLVVLLVLEAQNGRATMQELASLTYQSGATVTGIVDRLLSMGVVTRQHDDRDRRVVLVHLTDGGRDRLAQTKAQSDRDIMHVTDAFSDEELEEFTRLIQKFTHLFDAMLGRDTPPSPR